MEVYVYVKFSQDKDTGEEQLEVPEVYATKEAAYAKLLQQTLIKEVKQAFQ